MERHICNFKSVGDHAEGIGELIINGNSVEFYFKGKTTPSQRCFIGRDTEHTYKVFVSGYGESSANCSLDAACPFKVNSVLAQNYDFNDDLDTNGITECSFIIPELVLWLNFATIERGFTEDGVLAIAEKVTNPIILKDSNPHIEITFELGTFRDGIDTFTEMTLIKKPRITITYANEETVERVNNDIAHIMQFFGLLISHVSDVQEIRLKYKDKDLYTWLYENYDYSYNLRHTQLEYSSLTHFEEMNDSITEYFSTWYEFCYNPKYDLIRIWYFTCNKRKDIFAEDVFVYYVRFIEGYYLRRSGAEEEAEKIKNTIDKFGDKIKEIIFCEENKDDFSEIINQAIPDWKFNSKHAKEVSNWIARGYLNRSDLKKSLTTYDNSYFNIISRNACHVVLFKKASEEEIIKTYFDNIVKTRNYYSHFKSDNTGVLSFAQLQKTINVLKAVIVMIFFECMEMDKKEIQQYIIRDPELMEQTYDIRLDFNQRMEG